MLSFGNLKVSEILKVLKLRCLMKLIFISKEFFLSLILHKTLKQQKILFIILFQLKILVLIAENIIIILIINVYILLLLSLKIIVMIKVKQGALMIKIVLLVFWKIVLMIFLNEYWSRCMKRFLIYLMSWIIFHIHFTSFQLFIIKLILIVIF